MKVALVSFGSRGDVQPFVCLGRALADAGHAVELTSSANGERMARAAGLPFRPFAFDAQELLDSEEARRMLADGRMRAFFGWLQEAERPFLEHNRRVLIEAGRDADVIVSGVLMVARCAAVAEARGIPMVQLHLCPTAPSRSYVPTMLPQRSLGPANRIAHNLPQWAFYRSQRAPVVAEGASFGDPAVREQVIGLARTLNAETHFTDARAFVEYLDGHDSVDTDRKIGTIGYCMGGPMVMRSAAARPDRIGAGGSFHGGGLATDAADSPHRLIPEMNAEFLIAIAENDDAGDPAAKDTLREAFAAADLGAEIEVYAGAQHGWCVPDSAVYHEEQAERAWSRLLDLFGRALA